VPALTAAGARPSFDKSALPRAPRRRRARDESPERHRRARRAREVGKGGPAETVTPEKTTEKNGRDEVVLNIND
jgi:hypothetical protein